MGQEQEICWLDVADSMSKSGGDIAGVFAENISNIRKVKGGYNITVWTRNGAHA
jgi:hypothetical protein